MGGLGIPESQGGDVLSLGGFLLPAERLVTIHLLDHFLVCDRQGSVGDPDRIPVGVVTMMMGVEDQADRLLGDLSDVCQTGLGAIGEVGVDDHHKLPEDHDPVVAMALVFQIPLAKIDSGRQLHQRSRPGRNQRRDHPRAQRNSSKRQ